MVASNNTNNGHGETQHLLPTLKESETFDDDDDAAAALSGAAEMAADSGRGRTSNLTFRGLVEKATRHSRIMELGKEFGDIMKDIQDYAVPLRREGMLSHRRLIVNYVLCTFLVILIVLLSVLVSFIVYRTVYTPKHKYKVLQQSIADHAAGAQLRNQQCKGIDWQSACDKLSGASARRGRQLHRTSKSSSMSKDGWDEELLNSDDPSITYDNFCLLQYRMKIMGNITFPYHASSRLANGGNYTMALVIQHGALRNGEDYFCSFKELMLEQKYRNFEDILIIAPDFNYESDELVHPYDLFWNSTKPWGDWRVGAQSDPDCCGNRGHNGPPITISSFEVLDHILATLTSRKLFPNLNKISYVGHSAGGQMVQRYAAMSVLAALWGLNEDVDMAFIIANPSSYAYLTPDRYQYQCGVCDCTQAGCTCDQDCNPSPPYHTLGIPHKAYSGKRYPCYSINYNRWPYGIGSFSDDRTGLSIPYALRDGILGVERAIRLYDKLHVVYLVGQNDTCNDGLPGCDSSCWKRGGQYNVETEWECFRNQMDTRCPAMLQGPCRKVRGYQYMMYLEELYGRPTHSLYTIPGIGHDAAGMFSSEIGMKELFGPDELLVGEGF